MMIIYMMKSFSTILTLVRFITSVYMNMSLEITALTKSFTTVLTLVRFITGMYTKMFLEITILTKSFSTVLTLVRFITSVYMKVKWICLFANHPLAITYHTKTCQIQSNESITYFYLCRINYTISSNTVLFIIIPFCYWVLILSSRKETMLSLVKSVYSISLIPPATVTLYSVKGLWNIGTIRPEVL